MSYKNTFLNNNHRLFMVCCINPSHRNIENTNGSLKWLCDLRDTSVKNRSVSPLEKDPKEKSVLNRSRSVDRLKTLKKEKREHHLT